jgi:hypothetical protein
MEEIYYTYIFLGAVAILIWYLIINIATKSEKKVRNQQNIIYLLIKLCEKNGVPAEELDGIKKEIGMK